MMIIFILHLDWDEYDEYVLLRDIFLLYDTSP